MELLTVVIATDQHQAEHLRDLIRDHTDVTVCHVRPPKIDDAEDRWRVQVPENQQHLTQSIINAYLTGVEDGRRAERDEQRYGGNL